MRMRSSIVTVAPMRPSSSTVVVTSFRCGTLATTTGSSARSAAARIGRVAFLAPEMRTSPSRGTPPWICSLSTLAALRLVGRQRLDGQRVDLASHQLTERAVDEFVARQGALAGEFVRHDAGAEMRAVVRGDLHLRAGKARADQPRDCFRVHGGILHGPPAGPPIMNCMDLHPASAPAPPAQPQEAVFLASALRALAIEAQAVQALGARLG